MSASRDACPGAALPDRRRRASARERATGHGVNGKRSRTSPLRRASSARCSGACRAARRPRSTSSASEGRSSPRRSTRTARCGASRTTRPTRRGAPSGTRARSARSPRLGFGKAAAEDAWKTAEADALYKLHAEGVRVPTPVLFLDGVLLMELVLDAEGQPGPAHHRRPPHRRRGERRPTTTCWASSFASSRAI